MKNPTTDNNIQNCESLPSSISSVKKFIFLSFLSKREKSFQLKGSTPVEVTDFSEIKKDVGIQFSKSTLPVAEPKDTVVPSKELVIKSKAGFYDKYLDKLTDFFGFARVATYIPTIHLLLTVENSDQYSLVTWCLWILANAFTAAKVYKMNGYRYNGLVIANVSNTIMCLITLAFIVYYKMN